MNLEGQPQIDIENELIEPIIRDLKNGEAELQEIYDKRHICLKCVKLKVDKGTVNLISMCAAFTTFCFQWKENIGIAPWKIKCFGFCGSENAWLDTQDEIYKYITEKKMNEGLNSSQVKSYISIMNGGYNEKLKSSQLVGLKELYYDETHPKLSGPPKNESCGTSCKIIKKNPMLDNDGGGESWRNIGSMNYYGEGTKGGALSGLGVYDAIEENKRKKRAEAKKNGTEDKSKDLKGARKPNTGKKKESKTTDTTVIKEKKLKRG